MAFRKAAGITGLSCLVSTIAQAQVPQAAVEATVRAAPESITTGAATPDLGQPAPATADSGGNDDFLHRYPPQPNLFEVGGFLGPLFISDANSFRGATVVNPGRPPTVKPISTFNQPSIEFGLRGGYYPLSFLGGELEGMIAAAEVNTGDGAMVLAARVQAVAQLPYWSIVPFLVGGVGYWYVVNDVSGNDSDPAFHFGGGAKANITDSAIGWNIPCGPARFGHQSARRW